jgi:hypothetical protein
VEIKVLIFVVEDEEPTQDVVKDAKGVQNSVLISARALVLNTGPRGEQGLWLSATGAV